LTLIGLWITTAWLLHLDALHRFFIKPVQSTRHQERGRREESTDEIDPKQENSKSATHILTAQNSPPSTLGRYKVLKELGRGSMGVVYLGKDPTIQRFVAIKTMRLDEIDDRDKLQEVKARFFREAESTGRLSHPNIVTIFDAGEEDDLGYIAMEMLQGTTLTQWSRKPNLLALEKVISILATVAEAMDYAHQQGVVHRDIKPANIMLTTDTVVKIMDFGIAKMATSSKTKTDIVLGTPMYMSPEQIAGKKVDGRSDIFSLAVVMFELLTGRQPFTADNVSALLFAIAHTPHLSVKAIRPDLPPTIKEVLDRALQKDPVHRYRRAGEFAMELRSCLEGLAA
jgi:eukaryotic-like serine/threonine-protein kinase